jgi:hypothetical protein
MLVLCVSARGQIKAFPQAEGFGAAAAGGRGGDVYHVINLNDSGAGSLRYGIENAPAAGRTIVFDIGGWISITSKLGVTKNKITIAGQTAPGGIGLRGAQFSVGGDDIIVRHMRFRPGKGAGSDHDSINTNENAQRVIYDHISAEYSTDGGFDVQADELTLQYSSVSFGLISHSTGGLIQSPSGGAAGELSFHHNMFAHNETRNPKARAELIDWRDNVIYNFHNGFIAGDSETDVNPNWRANFDGNTYISNSGGNSGSGGRPMMTGGRTQNYDLYYGLNALDRDGDSADDPIVYTRAQAQASQTIVSSAYNWFDTPFAAAEVWQSGSPGAAYLRVLEQFGATPWARDAVNQLIHDQVLSRTGSRISHEDTLPIANAGYPALGGVPKPLDTDDDGIPDEWEIKHGLSPTLVNNNGDFDSDGFTDLEEYLNDLAAFPAPGPLVFAGGTGRYASWGNWTRRWEPSRVDVVHINAGTATVDAVGQRAGVLQIGGAGGAALNITAGWIEVSTETKVLANGRVNSSGGGFSAGHLQLSGGGDVLLGAGGNKLLHLTGLSIDTASVSELDLADNAALIDYAGAASPIETVRQYLQAGTGGTSGITSSVAEVNPGMAIGYSDDASQELLMLAYAYQGDANLDGQVDIADLGSLAANWQASAYWVGGDFDYDGIVTVADLGALAANWQAGVGGGTAMRLGEALAGFGLSSVTVPEPGCLCILAAAASVMPRRRRNCRCMA